MFQNKNKPSVVGDEKTDFVYQAFQSDKQELRDIEKRFARLFSSDDGQYVLGYLQTITFHKAHGPGTPDNHLHYTEGQRALVATILRLTDRGKKPDLFINAV